MKKAIIFAVMFVMLVAATAFGGTTERVSVASDGTEANFFPTESGFPEVDISADGRFVAFTSLADNLVPNDTNNWNDVFVYDRQTKAIERVSVDSQGNQANFPSMSPSISADGRYVAFRSGATNLIPIDLNPDGSDIFVHDRQTGITEIVSISSDGAQGNWSSQTPDISDDGRYVVFESWANNLVAGDTNNAGDVFVRDRVAGTTVRVSVKDNGEEFLDSRLPKISGNGRYVSFQTYRDNYAYSDVYVHDLQTGSNVLVNFDKNGNPLNSYCNWSDISYDGRYVVFVSCASLACNVLFRDMIENNSEYLYYYGMVPSISRDGKYISFLSQNTRIYIVKRIPSLYIEEVSVNAEGISGNENNSDSSALSDDGRYVVFASLADNLVPNDTNGTWDIFVRDRGPQLPSTPDEMATAIIDLLSSGDITSSGLASALTATLDNAQAALDSGNEISGENMLQAFINKIQAQVGKGITEEAAAMLIEAATQIIAGMQ